MCYFVINPCGYWTSETLSTLVSNRTTLYNVMGVKRHIMPVDLPQSVSISRAEINLTVRTVSTGVLCYNVAESKSVMKMCFSKHCHGSDRIFVVDWNILHKLCGSTKK